MTEREELSSGKVIRVFKGTFGIGPYVEGLRTIDFLPSSDDKRAAEDGGEVLLSVFDRRLTTPRQCAAIRGLDGPFHAWALWVEGIKAIKAATRNESLSVVRDPLPIPKCNLAGAAGHCGIRGLAKFPRETDKQSKLLIAYLAGQLKDRAFEEPID